MVCLCGGDLCLSLASPVCVLLSKRLHGVVVKALEPTQLLLLRKRIKLLHLLFKLVHLDYLCIALLSTYAALRRFYAVCCYSDGISGFCGYVVVTGGGTGAGVGVGTTLFLFTGGRLCLLSAASAASVASTYLYLPAYACPLPLVSLG